MLTGLSALLYRRRRAVLLVALAFVIVGVMVASGVFDVLKNVDTSDPNSDSSRAQALIGSKLNADSTDVVLLLSNRRLRASDPAFASAARKLLDVLKARPEVVSLTSYYSTQDSSLLSHDGHETLVLIHLSQQGGQKHNYQAIAPLLTSATLHIDAGGPVVSSMQYSQQIGEDLRFAETITLPLVALLLFIIFGGLIAAALPLLIGGLAILGSFVILRVLATVTDVSDFAINVVSFISLGLAIDYALFIVTRFREELVIHENDVPAALGRTMATAGRTILFSGLTVCTSLIGLLLFPEVLLRSLGVAAMAAALVAMSASLTILPTLLALLGPRVNALSLRAVLRRFWRRSRNASREKPVVTSTPGAWYRLAQLVMRWAIPVTIATTAFLLVLGSPFLRATFSLPDERSLPQGTSARTVAEQIDQNFATRGGAEIDIAIATDGNALSAQNLAQLDQYVQQVKSIAGVKDAQSLVSLDPRLTLANYQQLYAHPAASPQMAAAATQFANGNATEVIVTANAASQSPAAEDIVRHIRAIHAPAGFVPLVGGDTAQELDLTTSLRTAIPYALLVMAGAIFVLLFLMTGSLVIPLKAIVLNVLSLSATFGALVWIFQEGHLQQILGFQAIGSLDSTQPVLIFAIAFGLSMDYEVFLLSRIKEQFDRTGNNREAVARGLERTGKLITSAALLLAVVVGAFATSRIIFIQEIGLGIALAVLMDATIVRGLLMPAMMSLLGTWNWWAPRPLQALWQRFGLREKADVLIMSEVEEGIIEKMEDEQTVSAAENG